MSWGALLTTLGAGLLLGLVIAWFLLSARYRRLAHQQKVRWSRRIADAEQTRDREHERNRLALDEAQQREQRLRAALNENEETLTLLSEKKLPAFQTEINRRNERIAELEQQSATYRAQLADSADELATLQNQLQSDERAREEIDRELSQARETASTATVKLEEIADRMAQVNGELQSARTELASRDERIDELLNRSAEIDDLRNVTRQQENYVAQLENQVRELGGKLEIMGNELTAAQQTHDQLEQTKNAEIAGIGKRLQEGVHAREMAEKTITDLRTQILDYQDRLPRYEVEIRRRDEQINRIHDEFVQLREKLPELNDALREREASIEDLVTELTRQRERYTVLQQRMLDRGDLQPQQPPAQVIRLRPNETRERQENSSGRASSLVRPSIALEQPRGEADNLQRIRGIGPVLEQRLNEIGVFHFDQLANLTDEDVELVTLGLRTIPGRIDRDDWIGQATELTTATDDQRSRK